jgi:O-antigen/teichoic acid export membrane protein
MEKNNSKLALKSGAWYTVSNFFIRGIGLITTPIFTRLLTQEEFGDYNNYTSWLTIITIFVTFNLQASILSAKFDYKDKFDQYAFSILALSSVLVAIWSVILNIGSAFFTDYFGLSQLYINSIMVYIAFNMAFTVFQVRARYLFTYKANVFVSTLSVVGTALLSVLLVLHLQDRLLGRVLGPVVVTSLIGFSLYIYLFKKGKKIDFSMWRYALPICIPYLPHLLSMVLLGSMDIIMIRKYCGATDAALYSLAYTIGTIVTILVNSMNEAFSPWLADRLASKDVHGVRKISKIYVVAFIYVAVGIMLISPEVLQILGGEKYISAKYVMAPVTLGCMFQFLYTMFVNIEQYKKKTVGMAIGSVLAAILNYFLNILFIPKYGYIAAAYTTAASYLFLLLIHMFLVYRIGFNRYYSYRFIGVLMILISFITVLVSFMYSLDILRFIIIVVYILVLLVIIFKKKNQLISIIQRRRA